MVTHPTAFCRTPAITELPMTGSDANGTNISEHHCHIRAECVCVGVWVVYGTVGVGGAGAGGFWAVWA